MTDTTVDQGTKPDDKAAEGEGFAPITSQADLDRIIGDRVARERNKFADYGDLKQKAAQFDQLEESKKTELDKLSDRLKAAEGEKATLLARAAKADIRAELASVGEHAAAFVDDLDVSRYVGEDGSVNKDALSELKQRFEALNGPRSPRPDPSQASGGKSGLDGAPLSPGETFASFIKGQIN